MVQKFKFKFTDPRPKDCVVVIGNVFGNKLIHGPFTTQEQAKEWAEKHVKNGVHWQVVDIEKP